MTVYLVGAGPGDPGLLTLRGRELLARADAVLYDGLVDRRILAFAAPTARLIDVAKARPDEARVAAGCRDAPRTGHATPQEATNALLVAYGRALGDGGCVVRLKGGDPFVFGRGGEEALALAAAGVRYEVVPGVSSAVAAPAYAGIPVTHRGLAASVAIVTGHEAPDKPAGAAAVDWSRLATASDTLVVLMGVSQLPGIAGRLIAAGRAADTPAAVVEAGATDRQRVVAGTLGDLPRLAARAGVRSPAAIVVGEVVRLREALDWFMPAPPQLAELAEPAPPSREPIPCA